jgi:hypothetical protein
MIENSEANSGFNIHPNPASSQFTVELGKNLKIANGKLEIFDVTGRTAYEQNLYNHLLTINFRLLPGIYFVKVSEREKVFLQKLVIE